MEAREEASHPGATTVDKLLPVNFIEQLPSHTLQLPLFSQNLLDEPNPDHFKIGKLACLLLRFHWVNSGNAVLDPKHAINVHGLQMLALFFQLAFNQSRSS